MSDKVPAAEPTPRFVVEFLGPDWIELQGYPDTRFLVPPPVQAPAVDAAPPTWEGWKAAGYVTDAPAVFGGEMWGPSQPDTIEDPAIRRSLRGALNRIAQPGHPTKASDR